MTGGEGTPGWDEEGKLGREGRILGAPASGRKPLVATAQSPMGESPIAAGPTGEKGRQCRVKRTNLRLTLLLPPAFLRLHLSLVVPSPRPGSRTHGLFALGPQSHSIERGVGLDEHWLFASLHSAPSSAPLGLAHPPCQSTESHCTACLLSSPLRAETGPNSLARCPVLNGAE